MKLEPRVSLRSPKVPWFYTFTISKYSNCRLKLLLATCPAWRWVWQLYGREFLRVVSHPRADPKNISRADLAPQHQPLIAPGHFILLSSIAMEALKKCAPISEDYLNTTIETIFCNVYLGCNNSNIRNQDQAISKDLVS